MISNTGLIKYKELNYPMFETSYKEKEVLFIMMVWGYILRKYWNPLVCMNVPEKYPELQQKLEKSLWGAYNLEFFVGLERDINVDRWVLRKWWLWKLIHFRPTITQVQPVLGAN